MIRRYIKQLFRHFQAAISTASANQDPHFETISNLPSKLGLSQQSYIEWIDSNALSQLDIEQISNTIKDIDVAPKFTVILPIDDAGEDTLLKSIDSLLTQLYPHWVLILLDLQSTSQQFGEQLTNLDRRISYTKNPSLTQVANSIDSDYIGFIYPGGELSANALYENTLAIVGSPSTEYLYSDEDCVNKNGIRETPIFKPDFSPDLLDSQNYFGNFLVIKTELFKRLEHTPSATGGQFNHAGLLRLAPYATNIIHIPKILYHQHVGYSGRDKALSEQYLINNRKAIEKRLEEREEAAQVIDGDFPGTYRVKRLICGSPKISIIIPFKDRPALLRTCISSLFAHAGYQNLEVLGVSNNSIEPATAEEISKLTAEYPSLRIVEHNIPFNFSALCNFGVSQSSGDYILLLNNDIEITSEHWMCALLEHAQRPEIGAVGGKLYYPDGRIQHAGIVAGMHGLAGHSHLYFAEDDHGYQGALSVTRNVSAVTGALLMVSRAKYDVVNGLNQENLAIAYNDVDLCFKLIEAGYLNVFTPYCQATHNESASRGYEDTPEKLARLEREKLFFLKKWGAFIEKGDPYFNKNFDLAHYDCRLKLDDNPGNSKQLSSRG